MIHTNLGNIITFITEWYNNIELYNIITSVGAHRSITVFYKILHVVLVNIFTSYWTKSYILLQFKSSLFL